MREGMLFVMHGWFSRTPGCFESSRLEELMKKALLKATPPVPQMLQRDRQDWVEQRQE